MTTVTEEQALQIYDNAIHFDGLNICNFGEEIFQAWHDGGIDGVSVTCGLWENFRDSIFNIVQVRSPSSSIMIIAIERTVHSGRSGSTSTRTSSCRPAPSRTSGSRRRRASPA